MSLFNTLIDPESLPTSLWDRNGGFISLPKEFSKAYEAIIDRHNLRSLATSRTVNDSPAGGISKDETERHFAQQFDNSAARAQLALTNVTNDVPVVSDALVRALSGNGICITDAPCGAGAATYAFLCAVAELRAHNILPRMRLNVRLVGAEISEHAQILADELLNEISPFLESQAIFAEAEFYAWDVTSVLSTTDLISATLRASDANTKRLLVVANFSKFLSMSGKLKASKAQLEELFRYSSGAENVAVWLEPQMNFVTTDGGLLNSIARWVRGRWRHFSKIIFANQEIPYATSEVRFRSTLDPSQLRKVRLAAMRVDLERT